MPLVCSSSCYLVESHAFRYFSHSYAFGHCPSLVFFRFGTPHRSFIPPFTCFTLAVSDCIDRSGGFQVPLSSHLTISGLPHGVFFSLNTPFRYFGSGSPAHHFIGTNGTPNTT